MITRLGVALSVAALGVATLSPPAYAAESSSTEKANALKALEIEPEAALIGMKDCDLSIAIWQRLDGRPFLDEVRAAAVAAFSAPAALEGDPATCNAFIRTGVKEAKARDVAIEVAVKEQQRAERELKQKAALTIGLAAGPDLLGLSLRNFVFEISRLATGPQVRAAALVAYDGTDAARTEFLGTGIVAAYEADRNKEIDEEAKDDAAKKQKLLEDAARRRAMAVLLRETTDGMLVASDRDFITYVWENATAGTEVRASAERAVLSREPADWNAYIHTGIHTARDQDLQTALRRKFEADVATAEAVLAAAVKSEDQLLAVAARKALAGSAADLDHFVGRGQYDLDLVTDIEPGGVSLSWASSVATSPAVLNVTGCPVAETLSSNADYLQARAAQTAAQRELDLATAAYAANKTAANAVRLARAQQAMGPANAALAAATATRAACAAKKPTNVVVSNWSRSGDRSIRYFGVDHNSTAASRVAFRAISLSRMTVKPSSTLSYWIYPDNGDLIAGVTAQNSTCVAIDLTFSSGAALRDSAATDTRGNRIHPAQQCGKLIAGQWNEVTVPLGSLFNGKAITGLSIGYEKATGSGGFGGYIDDISITD